MLSREGVTSLVDFVATTMLTEVPSECGLAADPPHGLSFLGAVRPSDMDFVVPLQFILISVYDI